MITVTIWHNVSDGEQGGHGAMLDGYRPGDPVVPVFAYQADPAGGPEAVAEEAFAVFNGHPFDGRDSDVARAYYARKLRSLSVGDLVCSGGTWLAVAKAGWTRVSGTVNKARVDQYGTHPLPGDSAGEESE